MPHSQILILEHERIIAAELKWRLTGMGYGGGDGSVWAPKRSRRRVCSGFVARPTQCVRPLPEFPEQAFLGIAEVHRRFVLITITFALTGVVSMRHGPPDCSDRRAEACGNARQTFLEIPPCRRF